MWLIGGSTPPPLTNFKTTNIMKTTIVKRKVNYMDEQSINRDNNNGKIYGIYYYEVANEDIGTDDQFNSNILEVEWYESETERDNVFTSH